jgi:hypothetical protein
MKTMVIEFYTPGKKVKEWLINDIKDTILKQHKKHKEISGAEVCFKERMKQMVSEKICEINLSIFKDSIMITGTGKNFDIATRKALEKMNDTMALTFKLTTEPPDEIVSTVKA